LYATILNIVCSRHDPIDHSRLSWLNVPVRYLLDNYFFYFWTAFSDLDYLSDLLCSSWFRCLCCIICPSVCHFDWVSNKDICWFVLFSYHYFFLVSDPVCWLSVSFLIARWILGYRIVPYHYPDFVFSKIIYWHNSRMLWKRCFVFLFMVEFHLRSLIVFTFDWFADEFMQQNSASAGGHSFCRVTWWMKESTPLRRRWLGVSVICMTIRRNL